MTETSGIDLDRREHVGTTRDNDGGIRHGATGVDPSTGDLDGLRAIPEVILALAFTPLLGLTPMASVMAIGVGSIGTLGKLFYEVIEASSPAPVEAVDAVGGSRLQRLRWGVVPQVLPEITSFLLYRFEINVRASAVLGVIGAGGIGGPSPRRWSSSSSKWRASA